MRATGQKNRVSGQNSLIRRLFEDLKRRHVFRVAIGYVIAAWAIVEVCDIILPTFNAPDWVFRSVVAIAFLGFPVTIILAWVFDISGHKVVVTESANIRIPPWLKGVIAAPLLGLVGLMGWWVWSGYVAEKQSTLRPTEIGEEVPIVAVAPLRNVTGNPEIDWYSDGLANLVRDNLTRSRFLRVVSPMKWNSIVGDANDEGEIAARAQEEGIGFILTGEMLTTPGGITVSSRLSDTAGGVVLSSRQIENLKPESMLTAAAPIATQVKQGLNVPREEQVDIFAADFVTGNLSAYESYIAGLQFFLGFEYQQAEQAFGAALELAPDFAVARYRLAYIQAVTGRTEEAISNMEQALDAEYLADRERRYIEAALALFRRDYELAAEQFQALLAVYPFEVEARELLAKTYWGQYRTEDAIREIEILAAEEPQNRVIWSTLGWYLLSTGEIERAQPALERFVQLAPDDASSYTMLGDSLRFQGDFSAAREQYGKALSLDPDKPEVAHNIATMEYLEGNPAKAMAQFQAIMADDGLIIRERLNAMFPLVSLHAARGNFSLAIELLQRFNSQLKEEQIRLAMATSMEALFQLETGNPAAANELVSSAIQLSPGVPTRYLFARGLIQLRAGEFAAVEQTASEIITHALPADNPDRTENKAAAYLRGMALAAQGHHEQARAELESALALEGYAYAIYELGMAQLMDQMGQGAEALELLSGALEPDYTDARLDLEPERVRAILLRAEIQHAEGQTRDAKLTAQTFLDRFDQAEATHPARLRAVAILEGGQATIGLKQTRRPEATRLIVVKMQ